VEKIMDHTSLKKKLSTYVSDKGRLRNVSDELLCEVLHAWEDWTGTAKDFYKSIGFSHRQMAKLIGKAKKLKREGHFGNEYFKEIQVDGFEEISPQGGLSRTDPMIELDRGKAGIIRFPAVCQLVEFIEKAS
jgi:hypothetical protein